MSRSPNIVLFHVHKDAMNAAVTAFERDWPEARISNLLEDGLFEWVRETGGVVPEMYDAFHRLSEYAVGRSADGILYSCSAFRECIDACIEAFEIPMLKPNDAMIEAALKTGDHIAVLATVGPTITSISAEIEEMARAAGRDITLTPYMVDGAFDAMAAGDGDTHDRLVAETAAEIRGADVIVLAQFTLARAVPAVAAVTNIPVLNSPGAAVAKMRELLAG
ncbi:MAG: arylsulfatase [Rhodospirillaceae bacterium]|jgi:aspartate/glutamate racemase|nr:arylsulfatase [Rhodospirillaceae bacterium]MBT5944790.1 arylsulfatase [Rhodospirillaceae bacterium]MBT6402916.1 arylsulfatase [Rhodospirillaceae bacterium]MBT6536455.1 arylsulfatase [Rhodospirillaceae bacterium]MBT7362894.1 arylsulfatase [Rhodospirillaceae bacterium]